jgi:hypothetical protein
MSSGWIARDDRQARDREPFEEEEEVSINFAMAGAKLAGRFCPPLETFDAQGVSFVSVTSNSTRRVRWGGRRHLALQIDDAA